MITVIIERLQTLPIWLLVVTAFIIYKVVVRVNEHRQIKALGTYAPIWKSYLPWAVDFVYLAVKHARRNQNYAFWLNNLKKHANPTNSWTMELTASGQRIVFTADPENIKAVLATQFNDFGKGPRFNEEWKEFLGDSIFTTDHEQWHTSRQLIRPQFIKDRISDLETFEKHLQHFMTQLPAPGQTFDIADLFFRYTLDAATDFLLGRSVDSLTQPQIKFATAFNDVQAIQSTLTRLGPLNWLWPRGAYRKGLKDINEFVNPFIETTLRLSPQEIEEKGKDDSGYTFLHALAKHTRDRQVLRDQLVAVLLAGRDTTACTLSWLFYELSRHPDVVVKLREEIKNVVGLERAPTYADLKSMKYLTHTLNETLRLYPVVPFNVRVTMRPTTLPRGGGPDGLSPIGVLPGTPIGYSTLVMQRRSDLYPPEISSLPASDPNHVLNFNPSRWEHWTPKSWTYIPFNGGPRICIGQQFALTEMGYTVVRLLQRFERVENRMPEQGSKMGMRSDIVLQPSEGVMVALR